MFALALEAQDQLDLAWNAYVAANRIGARPFNPDAYDEYVNQIIAAFLPGPMKTKNHWRKTWSSLWVHLELDPVCWNAFLTPTPMPKDLVKFHWEANCFSTFPPTAKSHGSAEPTT